MFQGFHFCCIVRVSPRAYDQCQRSLQARLLVEIAHISETLTSITSPADKC